MRHSIFLMNPIFLSILSTRFTDHYHTCRAGTMVLLAYVHGAKMLKGCHAPPFSRNYFSELPKNQYLTVF